ncbi:exostosin-3-like isoform X1 [Liolophura sinensis]|uniref:exostosin-3-like isoform X1 n=2 Tax=Liolophura sinensis TaxID=3198878 RepID=UPI0031593A70
MARFDCLPPRGRLMHWLKSLRITRVIAVLLLVLVSVALITHYYLSNMSTEPVREGSQRRKPLGDAIVDPDLIKGSDLEYHVDELKRIKSSVAKELRDLESKRQKLQTEISGYTTHIDSLKSEYERLTKDLQMLKITINQANMEKEEAFMKTLPDIKAPQRILAGLEDNVNVASPRSPLSCRMHSCFDYSRCSLLSEFPVYFYSPSDYGMGLSPVEHFVERSVSEAFGVTPYAVSDGDLACLYVVLIGELQDALFSTATLEETLRSLPYWHGDGRNHVLLNVARTHSNVDIFDDVDTGRAFLVQSTFTSRNFRRGFDIVSSPALGVANGEVWQGLPPLSPLRRKYLLTFQGEYLAPQPASIKTNANKNNVLQEINNQRQLQSVSEVANLLSLEKTVVDTLKRMQSVSEDGFNFQFACEGSKLLGAVSEWSLCGTDQSRQNFLQDSTFTLILTPTNTSLVSTVITQIRLYEALRYGAVPVILGDHLELPFSEAIDWRRASIILPKARLTELHFFVRTYTDTEIYTLRHQGRFLWETYFGSTERLVETLLAVVRTRLQIPPVPVMDSPSPSIFNTSFIPPKLSAPDLDPETDDVLGPIEQPFPSPMFRRNFTVTFEEFNHPRDPFHLYPNSPFDKKLSSEAKFLGSGLGFRPINKGEGGAGKEFNEALGGNYPREQFTVVILTYEREAVLINALQRFKGLPHLNKVIVVWNNPTLPPVEMRWPEIGVKVHIVKAAKNSLNNRFLPYDAIETEAVLSIDDDAHLRHDEIIFGFRVWREERDRIVGFPGRFHAWDLSHKSWLYNSNYSCELSMVLTGAAFFHKYYAYMYSHIMPQAIRDKVDEYMNCEDIAMNFLVSHLTRKPPVKVTSRWTFRCPGCPQALSGDESHFEERHKCINFFVEVYGYMPLLYTQYRVDSVLFKTRLPHDKQKCFRYI